MTHIRQLKSTEVKKFRNWLLKKQKFKCPICGCKITDPVLDHSHQKRVGGSGLCRGVLCRTCNVFLAKSENNATRYRIKQNELPAVLRNVADYLEKKHLPYIHPSEKPKEPKLKKQSYNKLKRVYDMKPAFPAYPASGKLTIKLDALFKRFQITPEFYSK